VTTQFQLINIIIIYYFYIYCSLGNGVLSRGVRWTGCEFNHTPQFIAEVKNVWSHTSSLLYMPSLLGYKRNFPFSEIFALLRCYSWFLVTDVSGQHISTFFMGQESIRMQFWLTYEDGTDTLCTNVGKWTPNVCCAASQKSGFNLKSLLPYLTHPRGADKSLAWPGRKRVRKHVRDARDFNNIETRAAI